MLRVAAVCPHRNDEGHDATERVDPDPEASPGAIAWSTVGGVLDVSAGLRRACFAHRAGLSTNLRIEPERREKPPRMRVRGSAARGGALDSESEVAPGDQVAEWERAWRCD